MKKLDRDGMARVVRELDECPALKRWLWESRQELWEQISGCGEKDFKSLQGEISTINQVLDKVPET